MEETETYFYQDEIWAILKKCLEFTIVSGSIFDRYKNFKLIKVRAKLSICFERIELLLLVILASLSLLIKYEAFCLSKFQKL